MLRDKKTFFILFLILSLMTACATTSGTKTNGVYHRVKEGETLWRIARTYDCDIDELARVNHLSDSRIEAGSVLFIPHALRAIPVRPGTESSDRTYDATGKRDSGPVQKEREPSSGDVSGSDVSRSQRPDFMWPLNGTVSSKFGVYKGMQHNGIKINGKAGMPVVASAGGIVIHSAHIKYYGETIIIKHNNTYSTVYSHLQERKIGAGTTVKKGEEIGLLGKEEKTGKYCLHFEIRYKNRAKNPLYYLPK